jgi:iron complex transport system ATP-binding protein
MISWDRVEVSYDGRRVLGPVTLQVADGEWVGLLGPNGAGKSTMLKAAAGLTTHMGNVSLGGAAQRPGLDIAWMPQRPQLPDDMGVGDYVMLGRSPHLGYLAHEGRHDVEVTRTAMSKLDLTDFGRRRLGTLSGGEAQRAVLARALAQEAPVLLLDEPTSSLDMSHAVEVLNVIDDLRRAEGLTIVMAAHDLTLAGRFAERLVLLSQGSLVADGPPRDVLVESVLTPHYGAGLRVIEDADGPVVVPTRRRDD